MIDKRDTFIWKFHLLWFSHFFINRSSNTKTHGRRAKNNILFSWISSKQKSTSIFFLIHKAIFFYLVQNIDISLRFPPFSLLNPMLSKNFFKIVPQMFNQTSKPSLKNSLITFANTYYMTNMSTIDSDTINFPRQGSNINYALNWSLAKALVTPYNSVLFNSVPGDTADSSSS